MEQTTLEIIIRSLCLPGNAVVWLAVSLIVFVWCAMALIWNGDRMRRASGIALALVCVLAAVIFVAHAFTLAHHMGKDFIAHVGF